MKFRILYISLLLFCIIRNSFAVSIDVASTFITTDNGLSSNTVRYIFQDSKGFVWIGTLNGLNRYDSHSFISFMPESSGKISLADNNIESISEDANGFLWICTAPKIFSCYDLKKACFVDYTGCGEYNDFYQRKITASNGDIWLYHLRNGCRRVRFKEDRFSSLTFKVEKGNIPSDNVTSVIEDDSGVIWICTKAGIVKVMEDESEIIGSGLSFVAAQSFQNQIFFLTHQGSVYTYDSSKGLCLIEKIVSYQNKFKYTDSFKLNEDWIIFTSRGTFNFNMKDFQLKTYTTLNIDNGECTFDNKGNCWVYNGTGDVYYINKGTKKVKRLELVPRQLVEGTAFEYYQVIHDIRGIIWISTSGNGLYAYDPDTEELTHFAYRTEGSNSILSNFLSCVMEDNSGNIWTAGGRTGISVLSVLNPGASLIYPENKSLTDRSNVIPMVTRMKSGEIWISNRNGSLYQYDRNLKLIRKKDYFPYSIFRATEDNDGNIWLGSRGGGLCINGKWYTRQNISNSLSHNHIFDILKDAKGRMWIGTFGGGLNLAIHENGDYHFNHFFQRLRIRRLTEDKNGRIWIASDNGVYVFHPDSLVLNPNDYYLYNFSNRKLPANQIYPIFCDSKGNVWIGTAGAGFSVCNPAENNYEELSFQHYNTNDGLVNNMVQSIIEDKEGKMWIATEYGISRFDIDTKTFDNFFFSANMPSNYYWETTRAAITDDGCLLLGTDHGLAIINPQKVMPKSIIPGVVFTDLKINGMTINTNDKDSLLTKDIAYTDTIKLKYFQNSLVVEFSSFDFSFANASKYAYRLEYFDKMWSTPSSLNFAAYKNLPPGHYKLQVKAYNAAGVWANEEAVLDIIITPPFWKTNWALILYILLACLGLYITFRLIKNYNMLKNRILVEKQLSEYKLLFTNIAQKFRIPLTLIQDGLGKMEQNKDMPPATLAPMNTIRNSSRKLMRLVEKFDKEGMKTVKGVTVANDSDKRFIDQMNLIIDKNLSDSSFNVETFASAMGYKRTLFYQKAKSIMGITPNEYLQNIRLKKAAELLLDDRLTIAEVAYKTGFEDPSYFSRVFKSHYGITPTQFQNNKQN